MNTHDIRDLFDYNDWANRRILAVAERLTTEQFTAQSSHSFGSVQGTLVHMLFAEWAWRLLLQGQGWPDDLNPADFPTAKAIRRRWQVEEEAMQRYLAGLNDDDLAGIIRYEAVPGVVRERVLWHCLFHVVNHAMQHRSEAAHLLTTYGHSPGDIDFTFFLNERKAQGKPRPN